MSMKLLQRCRTAYSTRIMRVFHPHVKATGNSRFETEKFPPLSEKFPLSIKLNYHSLCNTSTLYMACIPYVVFMGHDVGYCVLSVLPLFSLVLTLTMNL